MAENINIRIDAAVEGSQAAQTLGQLKNSLLELQSLSEQDLGAEQFNRLQTAITQTTAKMAAAKDGIGDLQDSVSTLEGSNVERLNNSIGLLGDGIRNLDLGKLTIGFKGLFNLIRTNPIGLLASAVATLVTAFGGWETILGFVGDALSGLMAPFQRLLDLFGLGASAADKFTEAMERHNAEMELAQSNYDVLNTRVQNQIALMEAEGATVEEISDVRRLAYFEQLQQAQERQRQHEYEINTIQSILNNERVSKKERAQLESNLADLRKKINEEQMKMEQLHNAILIEHAKLRKKEAEDELKQKQENVKLFDDAAKKRNQQALDEISNILKVAEIEGKTDIERTRLEIQAYQERKDRLTMSETDFRYKIFKLEEQLSKQLQAESDKQAQTRLKSLDESLNEITRRYDVLLQQNKNILNDEFVFLSDYTILVQKTNEQFDIQAQKIRETFKIEKDKLSLKYEGEELQKQIALLEDETSAKLIQNLNDQKKAIKDLNTEREKEYNKVLSDFDALIKKVGEAYELEKKTGLDNYGFNRDLSLKLAEERIKATELVRDKSLEETNKLYQEGVLNEQQYQERLAEINLIYTDRKTEIEKQAAEQRKAIRNQELNDSIQTAQIATNALSSLSEGFFSLRMRNMEKGSEEELKYAKKQFEINKALQLATAVVNGAQGVLAITTVPDFTLGVQTAIRIASQVALTLGTIAKIASTKFEAPALGTLNVPNVSTAQSTPAQQPIFQPTQFFGLGQTVATGQSQAPGNQGRVYVVESDITNVQRRVAVNESRSVI